jgi:peptide/nickel transport system permease protein
MTITNDPVEAAQMAAPAASVPTSPRSERARRQDWALAVGVGWLAVLTLGAVFVGALPVGEARDPSKALREPTLAPPDILSRHPFGTDRQGLDVLGQILYGARISLIVGLGAALIGVLIGGTIGMVAGYFAGRTGAVIRFITDWMLVFPPLIFLLGLVAVLKPSTPNVVLALGILAIPAYIRLSRANTLSVMGREYVLAARALGTKDSAILRREILPNVALPLISYTFIIIPTLIVAEASLSFLGLGIKRPQPTWGNMIAAGQSILERSPHVIYAPGLALILTVFELNVVGDRIRAALGVERRVI